ncbi:urease accessory protein UreD [Cyanobium sp. WKJ7-Wakatipu]|uniref:urease accessory protein UreD n=1 Tax=Cyanobium sp. WKJ7-Wakatipu TaxID=2823726 RepID=UPI0037C0F477
MNHPNTIAAGRWHGAAELEFTARQGSLGEPPVTVHQGWATSPLKLQRAYPQADGRCELPLLHTAGGLVGGDQLTLRAHLAPGSQALLTSVAAQKVYGTVGRSRLVPQGQWARQSLHFSLEAGSDLEWLPQELVLFAGGLLEQNLTVELAAGASWLGMDVVRLGRSAAGETLGQGCWRSRLQVCRRGPEGRRWELVDPLEISGASLAAEHGMAGQPVLGSLVWAAPQPLGAAALAQLLADCRSDRQGLEGDLACGALDQGLIARYRGPSSQAARFWFTRVWARIRAERGLSAPELPRVWPFQEQPLGSG